MSNGLLFLKFFHHLNKFMKIIVRRVLQQLKHDGLKTWKLSSWFFDPFESNCSLESTKACHPVWNHPDIIPFFKQVQAGLQDTNMGFHSNQNNLCSFRCFIQNLLDLWDQHRKFPWDKKVNTLWWKVDACCHGEVSWGRAWCDFLSFSYAPW